MTRSGRRGQGAACQPTKDACEEAGILNGERRDFALGLPIGSDNIRKEARVAQSLMVSFADLHPTLWEGRGGLPSATAVMSAERALFAVESKGAFQ